MAEPKKLYQSFSCSIKVAACFGVSWLMIITSFTQGQYDFLLAGNVLRYGEYLLSDGGVFKLMFLNTSFSSNNIYLGIQYDDGFGEKKIIWVANRENPLSDHSGVLNLTSDGTLMINSTSDPPFVLYSGYRGLIDVSTFGLNILGTGNLVLTTGKEDLWQSIDDPTDTWLHNMKLGIFNLKSGQPRQQSLVSWLNPSVATSGAFTLGIDPNNTKQLVISQRGSIVWESGVWNGTSFSHLPPYFFNIDQNCGNIVSESYNIFLDEYPLDCFKCVRIFSGYMSPEYAMDGLFSEKSDVFSYGVMMLEIISGKKNTGFYYCDHFVNLLGYAWELWRKGRGLEIMDVELNETSSTNEVMRCIQIGLLCVQESAEDRPTMLIIMSLLSHESITVPIPKQPAFFLNANASAGPQREDSAMCSVNNVTLSDVNGR